MKRFEISGKGKAIGAVVLVALVMLTAFGITLAYQKTETGVAVNQFSVGNVTTELVEEFYQNTDTEFTKTPRVTNTGADSCLVRIRMNITPESVQSLKVLDADGKETTTPYLEITGFSEKWTLNKEDGFYYYSEAIKPGGSTEPLFETVTVNYDEEKNPWVDFDILLYHESVQAEVVNNGQTISDASTIWKAYDALK